MIRPKLFRKEHIRLLTLAAIVVMLVVGDEAPAGCNPEGVGEVEVEQFTVTESNTSPANSATVVVSASSPQNDDNPGRLYVCQGARSSVDIEFDVVTDPAGNKGWIGWRVEEPDGTLVASSGAGSADPPQSRFGPPPPPAADCSTVSTTLTPSDTLREFHVKLFCDEETPYCEKVGEPYMRDNKEITDNNQVIEIIVYVLNVDIDSPSEDEVFLEGQEIRFVSDVQPAGLSGLSYAWSVTQGTCDPSSGTSQDFDTTLKSEGTIKVKLEVSVGGTTCDAERSIQAMRPQVTKISWIDAVSIYDHVTDTPIDNPVWYSPLGGGGGYNKSGAYVRGGGATAEIECEALDSLSYPTAVRVRGQGVDMDPSAGPPGTDENFYPTLSTFSDWTWPSGGPQLLSSPLYNSVNYYDLLEVQWQYCVATLSGGWGDWVDMNQSSQFLYVTLDDPIAGVRVYEKLLDFSCHWAENETTEPGTFGAIWDKVDDLNATGYKYWGPAASGNATTLELLQNGDGQCGAWHDFFEDINGAHGIAVPRVDVYLKAAYGGLLVKNVDFQEPPMWITQVFPYGQSQAVLHPSPYHGGWTTDPSVSGIVGQGPTEPMQAFSDHGLNSYGGGLYDPSYGKGTYSDLHAWEEDAVAGYANPAGTQLKKNDSTETEVQ